METLLESFLREGSSQESIALIPLAQRTAVVLIASQILAWHYIRFARVLTNKRKFAHVLTALAVTTFLVITVVKTSLALSLGLVGALSIIRFRTPVKEAEELAYLFLAIAIGLGIGAEKTLATLTVTGILLVFGAAMSLHLGKARFARALIQIHVPAAAAEGRSGKALLDTVLGALGPRAAQVDLRRIDTEGGDFHASLAADTQSIAEVGALLEKLQAALPGASVSVIDREILE